MAQLVVRNLKEEVKRRLQRRAKRNGRSMEEEVRVILREALKAEWPRKQEGLGTQLMKLFSDVPPEFKIVEMRGARFRTPKF
jgi:antitoxin FitA